MHVYKLTMTYAILNEIMQPAMNLTDATRAMHLYDVIAVAMLKCANSAFKRLSHNVSLLTLYNFKY